MEAVGDEAGVIAERIRNTLVGADEGKRGLYFCHGFCELGAYEVGPVLEQSASSWWRSRTRWWC